MTITYTWSVDKIEVTPTLNGLTNVISLVHWRLNATDSTTIETCFGMEPIAFDANVTFTPYEQVTESQVIEWVQNSFEPNFANVIQQDLANRYSPVSSLTEMNLPWAT